MLKTPSWILPDVSLKSYTSWSIGGRADFFSLPENEDQLKESWAWALENRLPVTFLGGGSNVLISDGGVEGLVIGLKKYSAVQTEVIQIDKNNFLKLSCLSGTSKSEILKIFLKYKLSPALFLAGIPGQVGGGVYMNAGVAENMQPREFCEMVQSIEVLRQKKSEIEMLKDPLQVFEAIEFKKEALKWSYRHCQGWKPGFISKVNLIWPLQEDEKILEKVKEANRIRLSKQPLDLPSCGSVFVNPEGYKAAQLIDQCGLKGYRVGDAEVSLKHANFIVNKGNAKASDIRDIIQHVQHVVFGKTQVKLKTEVIFMGRL